MITVEVDSTKLNARLPMMTASIRASLQKAIYRKAIDLQRYIVREKLSAPAGFSSTMLHVVTHKLKDSIQQEVKSEGNFIEGSVFSAGDLPYARIHEYGGDISRVSKGKRAHDYTIHIPARSYMRTSLEENKQEIIAAMQAAVTEGIANVPTE